MKADQNELYKDQKDIVGFTPFLTPGNSRQSGRVLVVSAGAAQPLIWAR